MEGQGIKELAQKRPASRGPPCSTPLCHPVTEVGWPPWSGWSPEVIWRAAGVMFVGRPDNLLHMSIIPRELLLSLSTVDTLVLTGVGLVYQG